MGRDDIRLILYLPEAPNTQHSKFPHAFSLVQEDLSVVELHYSLNSFLHEDLSIHMSALYRPERSFLRVGFFFAMEPSPYPHPLSLLLRRSLLYFRCFGLETSFYLPAITISLELQVGSDTPLPESLSAFMSWLVSFLCNDVVFGQSTEVGPARIAGMGLAWVMPL